MNIKILRLALILFMVGCKNREPEYFKEQGELNKWQGEINRCLSMQDTDAAQKCLDKLSEKLEREASK